MPVQSGGIQLDTAILDQLIRNTPETLDRWLAGVAIEVKGDIVLSFDTGPAGITYAGGLVNNRNERGQFSGGKHRAQHTASAVPGPPAVDTGNLRAGIGSDKQGPLSYIVYAQAEYAPYLELSTERMAARPFFVPIFEQWNRGKLENSAREAGLLNV